MYNTVTTQWDSIVGDLTGTYMGLEYTLTDLNDGIVSGTTYTFKVRALNKWGWGPYTQDPQLEILAATIPSRVDIAVTTIDPLTGGVMISWLAPNDNGQAISSYTIEIYDFMGLWQSDSSCNGAEAEVIAALECVVPMDTLTETFGLSFDDIVYVRVQATNAMGQGAWSQPNSDGALIRSRPGKMGVVSKGLTLSTATSLELLWSGLLGYTETGNSDILAYNVWWDANSGTTNINLYEGFTLTTMAESLVPGAEYKFKIRAKNIYGYGVYSDTVTLIPDAVPDMMATPITSLAYPTVTISFVEPFDNGNTIAGYQI